MFTSLDLPLFTSTTLTDAGSGLGSALISPVEAPALTEVSFSELFQMPLVSPLAVDELSGEQLPEDGNTLPDTGVATGPILALQLADELPGADFDIDLDIEYPAPELDGVTVPQVVLLPSEPVTRPESLPPAELPNRPMAPAAEALAQNRVITPSDLLNPATHLAAAQEQVVLRPEAGLVAANSSQMLRNNSPRATAELPIVTLPVDDGATTPNEIPVVTTLAKAIASLETTRPPATRVEGVQASAAGTNVHMAATLSQFAAEPRVSSGDSLSALISTPVRDAAWGEKLGERVMLLAGSQLKTAEIRLTPADLGPLRVQVTIDESTANVTFHAQHALTRDAIEQALPRLREMLAESGLSLGQADVSEQGVSQGDDGRKSPHASASGASVGEPPDVAVENEKSVRRNSVSLHGLIDTFA